MTFFHQALSSPGRRFAAFAAAVAILRTLSLVFGHPDLGPDEGQYWFWSRTPDLGYFSKPPFVAWSIAVTTSAFGDAEWAVRLSAPLYQLGAAIFLFFLVRRLASPRAAFYAGAAWLTLPGVALSSALIATDAPLIFFWSAALFFFFELTDPGRRGGRAVAVLLGAAIGLGFLSKYAMAYFAPGMALALVFSAARRRAMGWTNGMVVAATAFAFIAPNLWWNAQNDFQTISHTAANANWSADFGHPEQLLKFVGDQFGIAGPIMLALIILAALFGRRGVPAEMRETMTSLLVFSIPAVTVVGLQAFIARAHGNWAAVAYPSAVAMATIWAFGGKRGIIAARSSLALHLVIAAGFLAAFVNAAFADAIGAGAAFRKLRGWEEIGARVAAESEGYDAIMTDDREITGELVYYARGAAPIVAWNSNNRIDNHFEAFFGFNPERDRRVLYVTANADALYIQGRFSAIEPKGAVTVATAPGRTRTIYLFDVAGYSPG